MAKKLTFKTSGLNKKAWQKIEKLDSPEKIQDFLNNLPFNHRNREEPPAISLSERSVHCLEGALVAAAALWVHGEKPYLLDLRAEDKDMDHVVALFRRSGKWGAISKTNHAVLRYREPVYKNPRELAMSFFHEYFLSNGKKTLRSFSRPFDLSRLGTKWLTSREAVVDLAYKLDRSSHENILKKKEIRKLRRADKIEIEAGKIIEWKK